VEQVDGYIGNFNVKVRKKARSVDMSKCTGCGDCWNNCMSRNRISVPERVSVLDRTDPEVVAKVDAIAAKYDGEAGMVIGALQDVQNEFNYLREDALLYLSEKSGVPLSRLYAVARFYNAFSLTPRGKNVIRVCLGTACHLKGGGRVADAISRELDVGHGETTPDEMFSLERVHCLGACALAPVITVNDKYYGKMTIGKMMKVIEQCREPAPEPMRTPEPAQEAVETAAV
jgi:NADH-quinone oxidoreductase subunit E